MMWIAAAVVAAGSLLVAASDNPPERIPSYVAWTPETIAAASAGDAFRGMLLARHCEHCHGAEGFSAVGMTPNLAGVDRLAVWKELEDFRSHKRKSRTDGRRLQVRFRRTTWPMWWPIMRSYPCLTIARTIGIFRSRGLTPLARVWLHIWFRLEMASGVFRPANHATGR